jgi:hypothetical protein
LFNKITGYWNAPPGVVEGFEATPAVQIRPVKTYGFNACSQCGKLWAQLLDVAAAYVTAYRLVHHPVSLNGGEMAQLKMESKILCKARDRARKALRDHEATHDRPLPPIPRRRPRREMEIKY